MKVLILDDQEPVGEIVSRVVQQGGWEAAHLTSAKNIAEIIQREGFEVFITDYQLGPDSGPGVNGLTVVADVRSKGIKIPVIMLTGFPKAVDKELAGQLGVFRILAKPLSIQELRLSLVEAKRQIHEEPSREPSSQ